MEIRRIGREDRDALTLKNDPFSMPGRLIPRLEKGVWSYEIEYFPEERSMTFPDPGYDFDELSRDCVIFAAYEDGLCVGFAIYQKAMFRYLYLSDLEVSGAYRRKGVGRALLAAGKSLAKELGYRGLSVIAQDNNLNACRFYLSNGFAVGGFDNRVYDGTSQAGKADIILYYEQEAAL